MVREKDRSVKSITAGKKTKKMMKREEKPTEKVLVAAPGTTVGGLPEVDTEGWAPDLRPHFYKILHPHQTEEDLRIPSSFSWAYLRNGKTTMCLRNQQGKYWAVNCIPNGRNLSLCGGWSAFVRENYLKIGDICIFELVAKNEMLVNIVRM